MLDMTYDMQTVWQYRKVGLDPGKQLFRIKHDIEIGLPPRGDPEVYWLNEHGWEFTAEAQWLSYNLFRWGAPNMLEEYAATRWSSIWHYRKAFANGSGLGALNPPRKNYITGENISNKDAINPDIDKIRICGGATVAGEVMKNFWWNNYIDNRFELVDFVWIDTLDSVNLPPIEWLIERPWLYFHATVSRSGGPGQFPNGVFEDLGIYDPTLVPLISPYRVGWPLKFCEPVDWIADPYQI